MAGVQEEGGIMRKWFSVILTVMLLGLTACGASSTDTGSSDIVSNDTGVTTKSTDTAAEEVKQSENTDSKSLVVYFSRSGENWNVGTEQMSTGHLVPLYFPLSEFVNLYGKI